MTDNSFFFFNICCLNPFKFLTKQIQYCNFSFCLFNYFYNVISKSKYSSFYLLIFKTLTLSRSLVLWNLIWFWLIIFFYLWIHSFFSLLWFFLKLFLVIFPDKLDPLLDLLQALVLRPHKELNPVCPRPVDGWKSSFHRTPDFGLFRKCHCFEVVSVFFVQ